MKYFLFLLVFITAFTTNAQDDPIQSAMDALLDKPTGKPFNGVVLVVRNDSIRYCAVRGYADVIRKTPLTVNSQFVIGSISKQITAVLVLQQYDNGKLQLNVPIRRYLPGLSQPWADTVTIHHLLTHTHGIKALDEPTMFPVGTSFAYSQIGYELLTQILEKVSGTSFAQLSQRLFKQCGMLHTTHPAYRAAHLVSGYTENNEGILMPETTDAMPCPAAGGFISTVHDLSIWNRLLHSGKLLKPASYAMMMTKKEHAVRDHPIFGKTDYAYGITVRQEQAYRQLGQTGYAPGYIAMDFYYPEYNSSLIILSNVVYAPENIRDTFFNLMQILETFKTYTHAN